VSERSSVGAGAPASAPGSVAEASSVSASTVPAVRLVRLRVRRTPGIDEAFELRDLPSGITLIYGPNGSGKSSTARAIEAVLWPGVRNGHHPRLSVSADYLLDAARYHVDLDGGHASVQRDGSDTDPPPFPALELRERYSLALPDLLRDNGADFGVEIARESAGGYDLDQAAGALGYREKPSTSLKEMEALRAARARAREARGRQHDLHQRSRELSELERRREEARRAQERERLLDAALRHAEAVAGVQAAERRLKELPDELNRLSGSEHELLRKRREEQRGVDDGCRRAEARRVEAAAKAHELFPSGLPTQEQLTALREMVRELGARDQRVEQCERELARAIEERDEARRVIGPTVSDEQLGRIGLAGLDDVGELAREAEQVRADLRALDAELAAAGSEQVPANLSVVEHGVRLLIQWLSDPAPDAAVASQARAGLWTAAAIAMFASLLLAVRWHWAFAIGAAVAFVAALVGARIFRVGGSRDACEREYGRLDLPRPTEWSVEGVRKALDGLLERAVEGRVLGRRASWREAAVRRRGPLVERQRALEARREALAAHLGVPPSREEWQLAALVERVGRWQDAEGKVKGAHAALETARAQRAQALADLGDRLMSLDCARPGSTAEAHGVLDGLERRVRDYDAAKRDEADQLERLAELNGRCEALDRECAEILARVGLAPDDDAALEALCAQFEEFDEARSACREAEHHRQRTKAVLETISGFVPELLACDAAELERELAVAREQAAQLEELTERVTRLREEIERAKAGTDLEEALADAAAKEAALLAERDRDLHRMVGYRLVRYVREATRDSQRPVVFHRARELFARITQGRYRLELDEASEGLFRATDTETGAGKALDELSSGTRVQLLIAVRVAFVETRETSARLPLLLDETLATSDEERARAIMEAVIALAESGRQIFHFTAQREELAKWQAGLDRRGIEWRCIDLAEVRGLPVEPIQALPAASAERASVPAPNGHTHEEYGNLVRVRPLRPGETPLGATPLWYVVDDLVVLHRLLEAGVTTWGALEAFTRYCDGSAFAVPPAVLSRAAALVRALGAFHEEVRVGRGKPVDREVLEASGAVSGRQLGKVAALARECGGRAELLLERLEGSGLVKKREELREYLVQHGYLDERAQRSPEEIRSAMLGAVQGDVEAGRVGVGDVDALIARVRQRMAPYVGEVEVG
jgi:energy-coupling factor transporter ATP-binding protein EcfA2